MMFLVIILLLSLGVLAVAFKYDIGVFKFIGIAFTAVTLLMMLRESI